MVNLPDPRENLLRRLTRALDSFLSPPSASPSQNNPPVPQPTRARARRYQNRPGQRRTVRATAPVVPRPALLPSEARNPDEQSIARRNLYGWLLNVPHREYASAIEAFREALADDPDFVARACVWLNRAESGQQIRDVQDVACITLLQAPSTYAAYRDAGRCALLGEDIYPGCGMPGLPPFRVFRVIDFVNSSDRQVPRLMRSLVSDYFAALEKDHSRLDGAALRNRSSMKTTWISYHLRADDFPRAHAILFGQPPADSRLAALKSIANLSDPTAQAKAIVENRIPYVIATSVIREWTPAVGVALIEAMSPIEAVNSRAWVERTGLLNHPEVRDIYLAKVEKARGSVASMGHRASAQGQDTEVQAAVQRAKEKTVASSRRIERDTLVLIDKSASMELAIASAQQFGARIGPLCDGKLMAVAFDSNARQITVKEPAKLASWEAAFLGIRASGNTSIGVGLKYAVDQGFQPHQVVIITDTGENTYPLLADVASHIASPPEFVFIVIPTRDRGSVVDQLKEGGQRVEVFEIRDPSDYWVYDQVAAILGGPPAKSLVDQILATELPRRAK